MNYGPERIAAEHLAASRHATELVELHLLVPSNQYTALEQAAVRAGLSVPALVYRTIGEFLGSPDGPGNSRLPRLVLFESLR